MESEKLKNINTDGLIKEEKYLLNLAFKTTNLKLRYEYYQRARNIKKIAEEIQKFEILTRGY